MRVRGYHLPAIQGAVATEMHRYGPVEVELPHLRPGQLGEAIDAARAARHAVRARSVDDVLVALDRVITNWLHPKYHLRQLAEQALPDVTGFSPEMVQHGLPPLLSPLRAAAIRGLLDVELGDRRVLDELRDGRHALGPAVITHVLSGNIPGLAAVPVVLSLALKSAVLVKSAAGDPVFPALFAESIREVDQQLADCLLATHWRGGDAAIEEVAFGRADVVVASGSDAAIQAITSRAASRCIGHGHKISFASIGKERLRDAAAAHNLARRLAYDVSLWDQQGCLSPQLCYVEGGGRATPVEFAGLLADELTHYATALPPRQLSLDERAAVLRFRQEAEWRSGDAVALLASAGSTDWSVSIERDPGFRSTCLNRCIRLKVVDSLEEMAPALVAHRRHLEATGLAVGAKRAEELAATLAASGVHRICPIGTMQLPSLSWRQSGRPRVADWVDWLGVEEESQRGTT